MNKKNKNSILPKIVLTAVGAFFSLASPLIAANVGEVVSSYYLDTDDDGTVDTIRWTLDKNISDCTYEAGDWTIEEPGSINVQSVDGLFCDHQGQKKVLDILITTDEGITGGPVNPVLSYEDQGESSRINLVGSNEVVAFPTTGDVEALPGEGLDPYLVSASPSDEETDVLETVDIVLTFSEPIDTETFVLDISPEITGTLTWSENDTVLTLSPGSDLNFEQVYSLSLSGTDLDESDIYSLELPLDWSFTTRAEPCDGICQSSSVDLMSSTYLDTDLDGQVDTIRWVFDEIVTTCTYIADNWSVDTSGSINVVINGLDCAGDDEILDILVSADEDITGGDTDPVISYDPNGVVVASIVVEEENDILFDSGYLGAQSSITAEDGASPLILSVTPEDSEVDVSRLSDIVITFTESMNTSTFSWESDIDFGSTTDTWSNDDMVLTIDPDGLLSYETTYTITVAGDQADESLELIAGDNELSWSFTTQEQPCGEECEPSVELLESVYLDTNSDGTVDTIRWTFDTELLTCTYSAEDWYVEEEVDFNISITGIDCDDYNLDILVDADEYETGSSTNPVISYDPSVEEQVEAAVYGDITFDNEVTLDSLIEVEALDEAKPVVIETTPENDEKNVDLDTEIVIIFTESIDSLDITISPELDYDENWDEDYIILTLEHDGLIDDQQYIVELEGEDENGNVFSYDFEFDTGEQVGHSQQWIDEMTGGGGSGGSTEEQEEESEEEENEGGISEELTPEEELLDGFGGAPGIFGEGLNGEVVVPGSLIKLPDPSIEAVYYVDSNGFKHVFTHRAVYDSWYGGDFSAVIHVSLETLNSIASGKAATYKPGSVIKVPEDDYVYVVDKQSTLRHIATEEIARELLGDNWQFNVWDMILSDFNLYTLGEVIDEVTDIDMQALKYSFVDLESELNN